MRNSVYMVALALSVSASCSAQKALVKENAPYPKFDREAHRGGRGLMPENTIAAMKHAIDLGMETIEMDLHITGDGKVIVSHDEYVNPLFSLTPDGAEIPKEDAKKYVLYKMTYAEIAKFDVGSKPYSKFPEQKKMKVSMPLLGDLIDEVQAYLKSTGKKQVFYNIETKSSAAGDGTVNPDAETFVKLTMDILTAKGILPYTVIQSFDKRTIQIINKKFPNVRTSWLVDNKKTTAENLTELGYKPYIYSPNYKMVTAEVIKECHDRGIKILPWTVNTKADIDNLKAMGVDGIITDYPNLLQ
ncbi:glycerophosphodiester phosphodiesterase family protein [Mucilaginibacter myungsuensis]|uniref:Glycerophosphodiester phosphodiesterase n=1 Tax=Mucilaginibacter myungsuensis TaxID=649104 RepID=A0A929KU11_9SPHI|nr:glycerophosphodiester phosphodiesterase family protein [Mucilaginibacter myungsuensis]MBE9661539.1 glycerophosphodiester phosphodiesterase [Mucilaginibacter myungsuensis]MDN3597682.1 glycerophosphodiester phosphodiesterase family protein [Mucilaginibacter myungsuensis]